MLNDVATDISEPISIQKLTLLTDSDYLLNKSIDVKLINDESFRDGISNILVILPSFILSNTIEHCKKKFGNNLELSDYLLQIIVEFNKQFEIQHLSTSSLVYKGRKPRRDTLEKLEIICKFCKSNGYFPDVPQKQLLAIIKTSLGNLDSRTVDNYEKCIKNFVEEKIGRPLRRKEDLDLDGLDKIIEKAFEEYGK